MRTFAVIVACDARGGIGRDGSLPWRLPADMRHFRALSSGTRDPGRHNAVIMGRVTWTSLPERFRPLPGRLNVVLTRNTAFVVPPGVWRCVSLNTALEALAAGPAAEQVERVFVIGGAEVYAEAVLHPACEAVYRTQLDATFDCDRFLTLPAAGFVARETGTWLEDNGLRFRYERLERAAPPPA